MTRISIVGLVVTRSVHNKLNKLVKAWRKASKKTRVPHLDWLLERAYVRYSDDEKTYLYEWDWIDWDPEYPYIKALYGFLDQLGAGWKKKWYMVKLTGGSEFTVTGEFKDNPFDLRLEYRVSYSEQGSRTLRSSAIWDQPRP